MTKEQRLLYQDMMGRIPFGLLVSPIENESGKVLHPVQLLRAGSYEEHDKIFFITRQYGVAFDIDEIKPYLRWKSDMTSDEVLKYHCKCITIHDGAKTIWYDTPESIDYLNSIFVDFRGLINKNLAIRAPRGMYGVNIMSPKTSEPISQNDAPTGWCSLEECKLLYDAGLNPNTADMCWGVDLDDKDSFSYNCNPFPMPWKDYTSRDYYLPCWSLGALLMWIKRLDTKKYEHILNFDTNLISYEAATDEVIDKILHYEYGINIVDACVKMLLWHLKEGHIVKPKWVYRLEYKDDSCGLWYNGKGEWCFESGIGDVPDCNTKTLPMDYDWRYKQDGKDWFSSCSHKEDLMHWYSLKDAKELISRGFVFTRYLATEYHEYENETVFIKETSLRREEIDIFELFNENGKEN